MQRLYDEFGPEAGGAAQQAPAGRKPRHRTRAADPPPPVVPPTENPAGHVRTIEREAVVWAEEARQRGTAAARALEQAQEQVGSKLDRLELQRRIQDASRTIGRTLGRIRSMRREQVVETVKGYVRQHPNSVLGAAAVGFVLGRLMRRS